MRAAAIAIVAVFCFSSAPGYADANPVNTPSFGTGGDCFPHIDSTQLSKYKAQLYQAVGSTWYPQMSHLLSEVKTGTVRIQYTVHSDGSITTKVLDGGNSPLLLSVSLESIQKASPFLPFNDAMHQEVGDEFTDAFIFHTNDDKAKPDNPKTPAGL